MPEHHYIDCYDFAKQSLEIHGKIRASNLPGLQQVLSTGLGDLEFSVKGDRPERDKPRLQLVVRGKLEVMCQRCLVDMEYPVNLTRTFILVADESAIPEDEFDNDAVDYLVADPKLDLEALVEEEVLLSLPLALRHENGCSDEAYSAATEKPNPFKVLEGLKKH